MVGPWCWFCTNDWSVGTENPYTAAFGIVFRRPDRGSSSNPFLLLVRLLHCAACRPFQRQIKLLRCSMRRLPRHVGDVEPLPGTSPPDEVRERIKRPQAELNDCAIDSSTVAVRNRTHVRLTLGALIRRQPRGSFAQGQSGPAAVPSLSPPHGRVHDPFYLGRCGRLPFRRSK